MQYGNSCDTIQESSSRMQWVGRKILNVYYSVFISTTILTYTNKGEIFWRMQRGRGGFSGKFENGIYTADYYYCYKLYFWAYVFIAICLNIFL
jgi:hypothetical protein